MSVNDIKSQKLSSDFSSGQIFSDKVNLESFKINNNFDNNAEELEDYYGNFYN